MLFNLTMGLHDPALAPVITGSAIVRDSFVAGKPMVVNGKIPGLNMCDLGYEAQRFTRQLIEKRRVQKESYSL